MAKHKFKKGEEVNFRYRNSNRQLVRGWGKVVNRCGRFYNIEVADGLVVKIYCNQVSKNPLSESMTPMSKTACESCLKDEIQPTQDNPFGLPKEEKEEKSDLYGKEYRLIRKVEYDGSIVYAIQLRQHFLGFSWWQYLTTDEGLFSKVCTFRDFTIAHQTAEEMLKGREVK